MNRRQKGNIAETTAANYLIQQGFEIVKRNFYTRYGEIDIVARDKDCLVIVEVKSISAKSDHDIHYQINTRKMKSMYRATQVFLEKVSPEYSLIRFDAMLMTKVSERQYKIEHIKDAFRLEDFNIREHQY